MGMIISLSWMWALMELHTVKYNTRLRMTSLYRSYLFPLEPLLFSWRVWDLSRPPLFHPVMGRVVGARSPSPPWCIVSRVDMSILNQTACLQTFIYSDKLIRLKLLMLICCQMKQSIWLFWNYPGGEEIGFSALRHSADAEVLKGPRTAWWSQKQGGLGGSWSEPLSLAKLVILPRTQYKLQRCISPA